MIITIYWVYPFDRNDEGEFAVLPQKFDRGPEWWSDRIGDRLWYCFDWEQIWAEKIDRNDDLTALVIRPEGESLLYLDAIACVNILTKQCVQICHHDA